MGVVIGEQSKQVLDVDGWGLFTAGDQQNDRDSTNV